MNTNPPLPPLHDLVRAYAATHQDRVARLLAHYDGQHGDFTYAPSRNVAPLAFSHLLPQSQIRSAMLTRGIPSGRKQNLEVADHLWEAGESRSVSCYPLSHGRFPIRRDLSIRVPADFLFVEDGKPNVFWFQPRRTFALTQLGLGVIGSIFRMTFLVDDLAQAGVELLDLSAPHKERQHARYTLGTLPALSDGEVTRVLQELVAAYDEICAMGRDWAAARRSRHPAAPPAPGLFG